MTHKLLALLIVLATSTIATQAQVEEPYIEVTGTSEMKIVPDKIHYIIEMREYFAEEFDGKSKPDDYRTKVSLKEIEWGVRRVLSRNGIKDSLIRTEEVGDYWREPGKDFLVSKRIDVTLNDFELIDRIVGQLDTRGIQSMRIGQLENDSILQHHRQGKINALMAAREKAAYLAESMGLSIGAPSRIIENDRADMPLRMSAHSNVMSMDAGADQFDRFRVITLNYSITARFPITGKP